MGILVGAILATMAGFTIVIAVLRLVETRDTTRYDHNKELARFAAKRARNEPFREIEEEFRIDKYRYPVTHNGWSTHKRYKRPVSRSSEQDQHRVAEQSLDKLLKDASTSHQ